MGSLIEKMIKLKGFNLIQTLMNLVIMSTEHSLFLDILDDANQISSTHNLLVNKYAFIHRPADYEKLRPYFGWVNSDTVKHTIDQTTQWGVAFDSFPIKRHLKSRNPALNVPRRHESIATDTLFSDTPAVDSGVKQEQVLWGEIHW